MKFPYYISTILFILCIPPLVFVLSHEDASLIAYAVYALSAVTLAGSVRDIVHLAGRIRAGLPLPDAETRRLAGLRISLLAGFAYGAFKLALGLIIPSLWLVLMSLYYFCLASSRLYIVRNMDMDWRLCFRTGLMLLVLNVFAGGVITYVVIRSHVITYPGYAIYAIAAWSFISLAMAVKSLAGFARRGRPALIAASAVKLSGALVSLFILQTAMISTFGENGDGFGRFMGSSLGFAVEVLILLLAAMLIVLGRRKEHAGRQEA